MPRFNLAILYVDDPARSATFYRALLGQEPIEQSATFAMFPLGEGAALGLWSRHTVEPAAAGAPGHAELVFHTDDVDRTHAAWSALNLEILQPPTDMDFGRTFLALDPDSHRLRVYKRADDPSTENV